MCRPGAATCRCIGSECLHPVQPVWCAHLDAPDPHGPECPPQRHTAYRGTALSTFLLLAVERMGVDWEWSADCCLQGARDWLSKDEMFKHFWKLNMTHATAFWRNCMDGKGRPATAILKILAKPRASYFKWVTHEIFLYKYIFVVSLDDCEENPVGFPSHSSW